MDNHNKSEVGKPWDGAGKTYSLMGDGTYRVSKNGGGWRVKRPPEEEHIQCSLVKSPVVFIELLPRQKIEALMGEYRSQEWLGYLVGRWQGKDIYVSDLAIPPHKSTSGAEAEAEPFHIPENCVGFIHSHHGMGAFHSGQDQRCVDKNYPVSLVVSRNNGDLVYSAVNYLPTPCGKHIAGESPVKFSYPELSLDPVWLAEAKVNIDKGKVVFISRSPARVPNLCDYAVDGGETVLRPGRYGLLGGFIDPETGDIPL